MPTPDDRAEFADRSRALALEMGDDAELQALGTDLFTASDRHDWSYTWTWLGVPIIQLPTDIVATQEVIWRAKPTVIIETGVARGGSAVLHASLLELLGRGKVVAIDIDIRAHNRASIEEHPLAHRIELIEGSSTDPEVLAQVAAHVGESDDVMVVLDSDHTHEHVLAELHTYASMVSVGQYLVVADTIIEHIPAQAHRPRPWGPADNPATARDAFLADDDRFERDAVLDGKLLVTSSPGGYLRRVR